MSTGKLIGLTIAWILASVTMGVVVGIFLTEILVFIGVIDSGSSEYSVVLNILVFTTFMLVVVVPVVFRKRFTPQDEGDV